MPDEDCTEMRVECAAHMASIDERLKKLDGLCNAVLGKNGGKGLKDTVATHSTVLKIIGAAVAIIGGAILKVLLT